MASSSVSIHHDLLTSLRAAAIRLRLYWTLIKSLQTGLLLVTAAAGYLSACCLNPQAVSLAGLLGSLFLAVGGTTVLNMVWDRDIDACMPRTARRPLPAGQIRPAEAWVLGGLLTAAGLIWAVSLDTRYAAVVLAGVGLDWLVYTIWLKRRTPWSIVIGGLAGGMPALAGRVLALGQVDLTGLLLALAVLLWIPTHILTFSIRYQRDYAAAGVPTFPAVCGVRGTQRIIALTTLLAAACLLAVGRLVGLPLMEMACLGGAGALLITLAGWSALKPSPKLNFALYKAASIYMLAAMMLIIVGGL